MNHRTYIQKRLTFIENDTKKKTNNQNGSTHFLGQ
jgi:hypothetical protein